MKIPRNKSSAPAKAKPAPKAEAPKKEKKEVKDDG